MSSGKEGSKKIWSLGWLTWMLEVNRWERCIMKLSFGNGIA